MSLSGLESPDGRVRLPSGTLFADVETVTPGRYRLAGKLVDGNGNLVATAGTRADLPVGAGSMTLHFAGLGIFRSGLIGPYQLFDVTLSDHGLQIHDQADLPGVTAGYLYRSFEHFPVEFDLGAFDQLVVDGAVNVDGDEIGRFQTTRSFRSGTNSFELSFGWDSIVAGGVDGPFVVRDLTAYPLSNSDAAGFLPRAHTTAAYDITDDAHDVSFAGLLAALSELADSGAISHPGVIRSLEANLDAGSAAYERENVTGTAGTLEAFRNELSAQRDKMTAAASSVCTLLLNGCTPRYDQIPPRVARRRGRRRGVAVIGGSWGPQWRNEPSEADIEAAAAELVLPGAQITDEGAGPQGTFPDVCCTAADSQPTLVGPGHRRRSHPLS